MVIYEWIIRPGVWPGMLYFAQSETSSWDLQFSYLQSIREDNLEGHVGVAENVPLGLTSANAFVTRDLTQGLEHNFFYLYS